MVTLVGELSVRSAEFRRLWGRHDVRAKAAGAKRLVSPAVGEVTVSWETRAASDAPLLVLSWSERGGPPVTDGGSSGFGAKVLHQLVPAALAGQSERQLRRDGVVWQFIAPLAAVSEEKKQKNQG